MFKRSLRLNRLTKMNLPAPAPGPSPGMLPASPALRQMLTASDGELGDEFGVDVSVNGNVLVVWVPGNRTSSTYVFEREGVGALWTQQQKLISPMKASVQHLMLVTASPSLLM